MKNLTWQRHDRAQTESQKLQTLDSCFDLVGSRQQSVCRAEQYRTDTEDTIESLSNYDGNGNENGVQKTNFTFLKLLLYYPNLFNL